MTTLVECIKRVYRVTVPGVATFEVANNRTLSITETIRLLSEDLGTNNVVQVLEGFDIEKVKLYDPGDDIKLVPPEEVEEETIEKDKIREEQILPICRINHMVKIRGEFTRHEYQKILEDLKYRTSKWIAYGDLDKALALKRIKQVGKRRSRQAAKYKVIDSSPIDEQTYEQMMKRLRMSK